MSDSYPHRYTVHGLTVRSNRPLGGLRAAIGAVPDATIEFARSGVADSAPHRPASVIGIETLWHLDESRWLLRYDHPFAPGEAWSVTIEASRMTVRWTPGMPFDDIPTALQGSGLASMLLLRDATLLHASAVDVGGEAILIMGDQGAGKSTTAAAFIRRGYALLADDTAALEIHGDRVRVHPGVPRLRLNADSAAALGWSVAELAPVFTCHVNGRKVSIEGGASVAAPLPVRAIYLLRSREARRRAPLIETVPRRTALAELLRNAYGGPYLDPPRRARLFASLSGVNTRVPLLEVRAGDSLDALPQLVDALVAYR
jgi:hypothetical protein